MAEVLFRQVYEEESNDHFTRVIFEMTRGETTITVTTVVRKWLNF